MQKNYAVELTILVSATLVVGITVTAWVAGSRVPDVETRVPVERKKPQASAESEEPKNPGTLIEGPGKAADLPGTWVQFRGKDRTNIARDASNLARSWSSGQPEVAWSIEVGEGHAGVVVRNGRVYIDDYLREPKEDAIRCLSLATGKEIWRYTYSVTVKRNHGMSRTTPAVTDDYLVALGPKCHVHCLDAKTGEKVWMKDLPDEFDTTVPPWYAGQCPLIEGDSVIIAPAADPLMMKVKLETGEIVWKTPNPGGWGMTHASIMPVEYNGSKQYVYCTTKGVVGVSAETGELLWKFPDWTITIATIPSPLDCGNGRILLAGGYKAGAMMIQLTGEGKNITPEIVFEHKDTTWGAEQHTPILYKDHIYGIIPSGELACMDLDGNRLWTSGKKHTFGLGPFLIADGLIFAVEGHEASLHVAEATPNGFEELASKSVLDGPDAWGPITLAGGRLFVRDLTDLVCLKLPQSTEDGG